MTKEDKEIAAFRTICCGTKVVRQGRASYTCSECKEDISMSFFFYIEMVCNKPKEIKDGEE